MNKQQGSVTWAVLIILMLLGVLAWVYGYSPAKPEDVQAVVQKAKVSAAATAIVQSALKEHPTPTNDELKDFGKKVDEQLTLEIAMATTGDSSLQTETAKKAEANKQSAKQLNEIIDTNPLASLAFKGGVLIAFISALLFGYGKLKD